MGFSARVSTNCSSGIAIIDAVEYGFEALKLERLRLNGSCFRFKS